MTLLLITMAINNQPGKLQAREEQIVREQSKQEQVSTHNVKLLTTKMIFLASTILHSLEIESAHTSFTDIFQAMHSRKTQLESMR